MLVCLRDDGSVREEPSSGEKMADQGRSLVPPAGPERETGRQLVVGGLGTYGVHDGLQSDSCSVSEKKT